MDTELTPAQAEDLVNLFPVPDGQAARLRMLTHIEALLVLAVDDGMDQQVARDWLDHYRGRLES